MTNFTKKQLAKSLCCPIMTFLWGFVGCIDALIYSLEFTSNGIFRWCFIAAIAVGGVLCTYLTLKIDIHTEYYLDKRLMLIAVVFVFHVIISRFMISNEIFYIVLYMLVGIIAYIVQFTQIRDENTDLGELTIIVLSDPILYWTMYWILIYS